MDKSAKITDIQKDYPELLPILLYDNTTEKNIYWATDSYKDYGPGFDFFDSIEIQRLRYNDELVIRPRVEKSEEEQEFRVRDKAEVFTPSWVCNQQNNLVDSKWFSKENVFNTPYIDEVASTIKWTVSNEPIQFEDGLNWMDYVLDIRMEMTCGEAPYLVSRYDTTTGQWIEPKDRIGILDRKLRVVSENTQTKEDWIKAATLAYMSSYGYEWQGDSLYIARENLLYSFIEYYEAKFNEIPEKEILQTIATIISWNIFQMDGVTFGLPEYKIKEVIAQPGDLFIANEDDINPRERYCKIKDWLTAIKQKNLTFAQIQIPSVGLAPTIPFKTVTY